ncbi:MAG: FtsQ-type POTRA domain-containing protein [Clostridia bacterium]|nr:FtsQ-type POTRA domain-containing protein [Clostridia bacterium]
MKKATKDKKAYNDKKNSKLNATQKSGIFNYDMETAPKEKLTRKRKQKRNDKSSDDETQKKERIKELQKRKSREKAKKNRELKKAKKLEKTMLSDKQKEQQNIRKIKQMRRIKKTVKFTFIVFILFTAIILFVMSPIFNISNINIANNEHITKESILGLLNIGNDTNIFKENNTILRNKLSENPYIDAEKTSIHRILPSTIIINIKEREVEFLLEFGSTFAYIDKSGEILEISNETVPNLIRIIGYETTSDNIKPGNKISENDIKKIMEISQITNIAKNFDIYTKITSINIEDDSDYQLFLEGEGKTIHFGDNTSIDTKMMYIKAILEKEKDNNGEIFVNVDLNKKNAYFKQNV